VKYLLLVVTFLSSFAYGSGTQEFSVVNIGVTRLGNYAFIDITPNQTVSNCNRKNQVRWELNTDADKAILSLAITAQTIN